MTDLIAPGFFGCIEALICQTNKFGNATHDISGFYLRGIRNAGAEVDGMGSVDKFCPVHLIQYFF